MTTTAEELDPDASRPARKGEGSSGSARRHIRGSALLFVGRLLALGVNFVTQVLTVRYLAKADYGAFAYAMTIANTGSTVVLLGSNRGLSRLLPIYEEREDLPALFGSLALALGTVLGLGMALVLVTIGLRDVLATWEVVDPAAIGIVVILIALAPLQALDTTFQALMAVFARPRAIFVRRYVVGPALKLAAIGTVLLVHGSVEMLAACHLVAGVLGVALYVWLLTSVMGERGLWKRFRPRRPRVPWREFLGYTLPLLSTDVAMVLRGLLPVFVLGLFASTEGVAEYRAVLPVAALNLVVLQSMKPLFVPSASRLFARDDHAGVEDFYWRTTLWIAVLTFPVVGMTLFVAEPVTELLFGARYAGAGDVLAVLAFGHYVNAALGLNAFTLQVYKRLRELVVMNLAATVAAVVLNVVLIRSYGALGAAWATTGTFLLQNAAAQYVLFRRTPVAARRPRYLAIYARILGAALALELLRRLVPGAPLVLAAGVLLAALVLARSSRATLDLSGTFPELGRLPLVGRLLGFPPRGPGGR